MTLRRVCWEGEFAGRRNGRLSSPDRCLGAALVELSEVAAGKVGSVIKSIEINGFRGIQHGKVEGLAPLTVVVGASGHGKSTILEALYIACAPQVGLALQQMAQRRRMGDPGRWLFWKGDGNRGADLTLSRLDDGMRKVKLSIGRVDRVSNGSPMSPRDLQAQDLASHGHPPPYECVYGMSDHEFGGFALLAGDGAGTWGDEGPRTADPGGEAAFLQSFRPRAEMSRLYSEASIKQLRSKIDAWLTPAIPGYQQLESLTDSQNRPVLFLHAENRAVPVEAAGDGIMALVRTVLELATIPQKLCLLEDPEVHQHPAAMGQSAKAMVAAVRSGMQLILTTHSLELIDSLLGELGAERGVKAAVITTRLVDGELRTAVRTGESLERARFELDQDLR